MKDGLGTLLDEAATGARDYAKPARAVAAARRRRALRTRGAAVMVVAVLLGGSWTWERAHLPPGPPAAPTPVHPVYPPLVTPPTSAPPLPEDRAVGEAAFLYSPCVGGTDCPGLLVLPDGTQFRAPQRAAASHASVGYSLSPDGRFLGWTSGDGYRIRDLSGTSVIDVVFHGEGGGTDVSTSWSPDSRYLAIGFLDQSGYRRYALVTTDGTASPAPVPEPTHMPPHENVFGVLNTGTLVMYDQRGRTNGSLRFVDPVTGSQQRPPVGVDVGEMMSIAEGGGGRPLLAPCGCEVDFPLVSSRVHGSGDPGREIDHSVTPVWPAVRSGLIRVDLATGRLITRADVPAPETDPAGEKFTSVWAVGADLPGGMVALNWRTDRTEIVLINSVDGSRTMVTRLPPRAFVLVRGV